MHRAIKWLNDKRSAKGFRYRSPEMEQLGEHRPRTERRADEATREVAERLKCLSQGAGRREVRRGHCGSVVAVRTVRSVAELQADGLVHVTALPRDYYHRDPTGTMLKGERCGRRTGSPRPCKVRLAAVNVEERKIDFDPAETARASNRPPAGAAKRRGGG